MEDVHAHPGDPGHQEVGLVARVEPRRGRPVVPRPLDDTGDQLFEGLGVVLAAGVREGPPAIIFRVFTDRAPNALTAADYLPAPWCHLAAAGATIAAFAVIVLLDARHRRASARGERPGGG
ncbi:hypothetical protein OG339_12050 [Streptosporangium sp. NBC_01495]|uniref:hypothetical protein n=1 Tax=Streptosporangium sp. NBC_01495 TaxID=2903899 RepID=UPI002E31B34A|nr:hypothetical protein [Streptosporangium sp. NBC_01495]